MRRIGAASSENSGWPSPSATGGDRQDELVSQSVGDETAGEAHSAMGNDRLALLGFQLRDFRRQVAARTIGIRPTLCAGLLIASDVTSLRI